MKDEIFSNTLSLNLSSLVGKIHNLFILSLDILSSIFPIIIIILIH